VWQGINYGGGDGKSKEIRLRLRRVGDENAFYEYEDLLLVMLHELTHNTIGPHNQTFYKTLDELIAVSDYFSLMLLRCLAGMERYVLR
jgi:predicted metal-dependent hydrolase